MIARAAETTERQAMNRILRSAPVVLALLMAALAPWLTSGCAKKIPSGPLGEHLLEYPAGPRDTLDRSPSDLVVWPDVELAVKETSSDTLIIPNRTFTVYRTAPGVLHGAVVDYVEASGYQMFRQEDGGGYRMFADFPFTASRRFADRCYYGGAAGALVLPPAQFFTITDPTPAGIPLKGYVGRAVVAGLSGAGYPVTNLAQTPDSTAIPPLRYLGLTGPPANPGDAPRDTLLELSWETIPGAVGYWVHIYQKRADIRTSEEAFVIAQPSPIATGKVKDLFLAYFPAPRTAYKLGDAIPRDCRVIAYRALTANQEVLIRISAVNAAGRMIATTGSAGNLDAVSERFGQVDRRREFIMGAVKVTPRRP